MITKTRYRQLENLLKNLLNTEPRTKDQEELLVELLDIPEIAKYVLVNASLHPPKKICPCCGRKIL